MKESDLIEFKREFVSDLNKEVIAFANTNGGEIFVGVDDNGNACDIDIVDTELQCSQHIANTIKPDISMFVKYERTEINNKTVLKITVNKGSMSPYYISSKGIRPEGVYIRVNSASVPATETAILNMIKETTGNSFENIRSLNQNLTFVKAENEFIQAGLSFAENQKRTLGLIGRDNLYTNLALLLSDQCENSIKFAYFEGTKKEVFKDRHEFNGSLFQQLDDLIKTIDRYNKLSSPKLNSIKRQDDRDYPEEAVREAVLNSIVHRDYSLSGYTLVSMFEDRLEILSLGGLMRGVDIDDVLMGVSFLRNPNLANIFYRLHYIEAYGTGITKIKNCYENRKEQPSFECTSNAFKVVLPKLSKYLIVDENDIKKEEQIINLIKQKKEITRSDVEQLLQTSQASATRLLNNMIKDNKINKNGAGRQTRYTL